MLKAKNVLIDNGNNKLPQLKQCSLRKVHKQSTPNCCKLNVKPKIYLQTYYHF